MMNKTKNIRNLKDLEARKAYLRVAVQGQGRVVKNDFIHQTQETSPLSLAKSVFTGGLNVFQIVKIAIPIIKIGLKLLKK